MSETTIQVPAEHLEAIQQGLIGRRELPGHRAEVERLLGQIATEAPGGDRPRELTGARVVLWSAVYDALCAAAEQLAEDCNEYWRGDVDPAATRAAVATVSTRLALLIELGEPPGD